MGQTTDQIETHIEHKREDLGSNLQELEEKVKSVTDWRQQFQHNPLTMLGFAVAGGALLATITSGPKRSRTRRYAAKGLAQTDGQDAEISTEKRKILDTWDTIKGALVGVAATHVKGFLAEVIPNFDEHFQKAESEKTSGSSLP